jgi:hypothetical protein
MVYLSCPQPPEDREPGRKKYSRKEKENAHFYIRKIKSIPPSETSPRRFFRELIPVIFICTERKRRNDKRRKKKTSTRSLEKIKNNQ